MPARRMVDAQARARLDWFEVAAGMQQLLTTGGAEGGDGTIDRLALDPEICVTPNPCSSTARMVSPAGLLCSNGTARW